MRASCLVVCHIPVFLQWNILSSVQMYLLLNSLRIYNCVCLQSKLSQTIACEWVNRFQFRLALDLCSVLLVYMCSSATPPVRCI